jgi:hypothetical protein
MNNQILSDIISSPDFVTAYRAYDVCHNINNVLKIRSINNTNYDLNIPDIKNVYYFEDTINGQKIPFIYGDNDSIVNFPNLITNSSYTICTITKYLGINQNLQNSILTYSNNTNSISIGQYNKWSGIVYNSDTSFKSSDNNNNNEWVVTCLSFNTNNSTVMIGSKKYPSGNIYKNITNLPAIQNGKLVINNNPNANFNSQWALSHLFVFKSALSFEKLNNIYSIMISYLSKPATNDLILYKGVYPRNLPSCVSENFANNDDNNKKSLIDINIPLWAGYYAGDYDKKLGILPEMTGNKSRDLTSDKLKNVFYDNDYKYIYGSKNSSVIFPQNSLSSKFTICTITKYLSDDVNSNNMIIQSTTNNADNLFYHGHFNNRKGVIMYDNYELSKGFPTNNPINSWVVTCAKNTNSLVNPTNNVLIDDNYEGLSLEDNYSNKSNTLSINYNNSNNNSFNSDWGLSYILIWNDWLSDADLKKVSTALNNYVKNGTKLNFASSVINSNSNSNESKNNFICPGLNLTELQKKMLLL